MVRKLSQENVCWCVVGFIRQKCHSFVFSHEVVLSVKVWLAVFISNIKPIQINQVFKPFPNKSLKTLNSMNF